MEKGCHSCGHDDLLSDSCPMPCDGEFCCWKPTRAALLETDLVAANNNLSDLKNELEEERHQKGELQLKLQASEQLLDEMTALRNEEKRQKHVWNETANEFLAQKEDVRDQLKALKAKMQPLQDALSFYADPDSWVGIVDAPPTAKLMTDGGLRAVEALKDLPQPV